MSKECNCETNDAVKAQNEVCPKCGQRWTENESRSISVLVTAPQAMQGDTR